MANITSVKLGNVKFGSDYNHTLFFESKTAQTDFFNSSVFTSSPLTNFTYVQKDNIIRIPLIYDQAIKFNYVSYVNQDYDNKTFYAFITGYKWLSDGATEITISTDVLQTWMFDISVHGSFIEREHTNDDTVGNNTLPENLETGEYIINSVWYDHNLDDYCYVIQASEYAVGDDVPYAINFGGVFAPGTAYICNNMEEVTQIILQYQDGRADAILNVYMIPKRIVNNTSGALQFSGQSEPVTYEDIITKPKFLDSYKPKNKKLFTYPYQYLLVDNNNGSSNILYFELFEGENDNCIFTISGVPTCGGSIKCTPKNYKRESNVQIEGILAGKYPTLGWSNDTYTNWLTQNAVNIGLGVVSSGAQIIGGLGLMATGGGAMVGASSVMAGGMGIAQALGQVYQHSIIPNSAKGNINGGDINTCAKTNKFYYYSYSIKSEYAQIIDEYFTMYGYKTNRVKIPYKNHRSRFWYTKTIDVNISGGIPTADLQKIKDCYNSGITFWKDKTNIYNYSLDNNIL